VARTGNPLRAATLPPPMRPVRVRLFATAREAVGSATLDWPVPPGGLTARELVHGLREAYPRLGPTLRTSRFLRNDRYLEDLGERISPGDEFAVHPPYSGG
jgi:molybdopterin converting factor small subunit